MAPESARAFRLALAPPDWPGHVPGQHLDVRLTAADGYTAQRSYSIASAPSSGRVDLVVERLPDGEVSPYLTDVLVPGDLLELRGPIGGYFVQPDGDAPVQLIAGGSGVVPFLSMLGHHRAHDGTHDGAHHRAHDGETRLLYSARTAADLIGRAELARADGAVHVTLTRGAPPGWTGLTGRVDAAMLAAVTVAPDRGARVLVCGPTGFVEAVAHELVGLGHPPGQIRTERFGATGGQ
ncbi:ferredoxin reductase [Georgenia yuyongxinii]